jgi:hypothetical protein
MQLNHICSKYLVALGLKHCLKIAFAHAKDPFVAYPQQMDPSLTASDDCDKRIVRRATRKWNDYPSVGLKDPALS